MIRPVCDGLLANLATYFPAFVLSLEVNLKSIEADGKIVTYQHPVVNSSDPTNCKLKPLTAQVTVGGSRVSPITTTTSQIQYNEATRTFSYIVSSLGTNANVGQTITYVLLAEF